MTTMPRNTQDTQQQFKDVMQECRDLFGKKLIDYGASWRIMRTSSLTDQLFIKAKRIRSLEVKGEAWVDEGIRPADEVDMQPDEALKLYDSYAQQALSLMIRKNHDYDEAWRGMRVSSYTDFILTKIQRVKELEQADGRPLVSEGIDSNYMDIINYAVFGAIKLKEAEASERDGRPSGE